MSPASPAPPAPAARADAATVTPPAAPRSASPALTSSPARPSSSARPWLPWLALGLVLGALCPVALQRAWPFAPGPTAALLLAPPMVAFALLGARRWATAARLAAFAAAAIVGAALAHRPEPEPAAVSAAMEGRLLAVEGTVASVWRRGFSQAGRLQDCRSLAGDGWTAESLALQADAPLPGLLVGDRVVARGVWTSTPRGGRLEAVALERVLAREDGPRGWAWRAVAGLGPRQSLGEALLIGQGDPPETADFRQSGLLHVLAVSGMHLAIAAAMAAWLLRVAGVGWAARLVLVTALIAGYAWLTSASPATTRALAMALAVAAMDALSREPHRLAAASAAALLLVGLQPEMASNVGFQLSLAAVLGIVTLGIDLVALRQRLLPLAPWPLDRPSWRGGLWCARASLDGLAIGVAASLATAPLVGWWFCVANPWSPLATLLAAAPTTGALWLGLPCLTLAGAFPHGPWEGLYLGLEACLDALAGVAAWAATWPGATIRVGTPSAAALMLWPLLFLPLRDLRDLALRLGAVACCLLLW